MGERTRSASDKTTINENYSKMYPKSKLTLGKMLANLDAAYHKMRQSPYDWPGRRDQEARLGKQVGDLHRLLKKPAVTRADMSRVIDATEAIRNILDYIMSDPKIMKDIKDRIFKPFEGSIDDIMKHLSKDQYKYFYKDVTKY